ncbi:hypothetical protein CLOM_g6697 [Closterium sp. NIES-68]|nr:hypothetical protein CLOM_g6697 [Closterium sp. NIES-68]GJP80658.1 hypothetical protein CLOP_g10859 [Closterium sp. NIES-67]
MGPLSLATDATTALHCNTAARSSISSTNGMQQQQQQWQWHPSADHSRRLAPCFILSEPLFLLLFPPMAPLLPCSAFVVPPLTSSYNSTVIFRLTFFFSEVTNTFYTIFPTFPFSSHLVLSSLFSSSPLIQSLPLPLLSSPSSPFLAFLSSFLSSPFCSFLSSPLFSSTIQSLPIPMRTLEATPHTLPPLSTTLSSHQAQRPSLSAHPPGLNYYDDQEWDSKGGKGIKQQEGDARQEGGAQDRGQEGCEEEESFEAFYADLHTEFQKYGEIYNFKVCRNAAPHLRGNVYADYLNPAAAAAVFTAMSGRFYGCKQLLCLFAPIDRWRNAICGEYRRKGKRCPRGPSCPFLHPFPNPQGDYEWADFDAPPPLLWQQQMQALYGGERDYEREIEARRARSEGGRERGERRRDEAEEDGGECETRSDRDEWEERVERGKRGKIGEREKEERAEREEGQEMRRGVRGRRWSEERGRQESGLGGTGSDGGESGGRGRWSDGEGWDDWEGGRQGRHDDRREGKARTGGRERQRFWEGEKEMECRKREKGRVSQGREERGGDGSRDAREVKNEGSGKGRERGGMQLEMRDAWRDQEERDRGSRWREWRHGESEGPTEERIHRELGDRGEWGRGEEGEEEKDEKRSGGGQREGGGLEVEREKELRMLLLQRMHRQGGRGADGRDKRRAAADDCTSGGDAGVDDSVKESSLRKRKAERIGSGEGPFTTLSCVPDNAGCQDADVDDDDRWEMEA